MKQTIKTIIFLGLMLVGAGQAWGEDLGYIAYTQGSDDGGSLAFYKDATCTSEITITDGKSGALTGQLGTDGKVYIKVTPDATHQARGVTITVEKKVDSVDPIPPTGVPWWDGEANARRSTPSVDETITVETVDDGIYYFVMPDDGTSVTVKATLKEKVSYAINKGTVKDGDIAFFNDESCETPITTAVMDQTVYIKVTPDNGYELNGITAQTTVPSVNAESRRSTPATTTIPLDGQVAVTLVDGTTDVYQLTMPPANVEVAATFTPVVYSIVYDLGGGSVATDNPTSYTIESDPITLVNPTFEGYTFGGWTGSNGDTPQTEVTIVTGQTGNRNYKAVWYTEATVQVAWEDMDNHDGIRPVSVTATLSDGTEVTLSSSNSWTSTVTNLPAFDTEGQAIVYTWTESEVDGYELVGSTTEDGATTLTYSHTPTVTLTIGSGGWATYYHEDGLTYSVSDGAQAYYVSGIGESVVNLTAIDVVPSGLPVLISGSGTVTLTAGATEVEVSDNDARFQGTPTALSATDFTDFAVGRTYVLYKGVFLLADTNSGIGAHKCWLTLSGSNARQLNLNVGDATGITPTPNPSRAGGEWYTLDGRKLSGEPTRKGLHIYNGKKVIK